MSERQLVTRETLRRELILHAARNPVALFLGGAVAVAALLIGIPWLLIVAVALYLAFAATMLFDPEEAERVGRMAYKQARPVRPLPAGLATDLTSLLERARAEEARILRAIQESGQPLGEIEAEVNTAIGEMERIARRAQVIADYLAEQQPDDLRARIHALRREQGGGEEAVRARERAQGALEDRLALIGSLEAELGRFRAEMEHLIASLGLVHGQLVRISVAEDSQLQEDVALQVRDLRERVAAVAEGMREAVAQLER